MIYIVSTGYYSDYRVVKVFSTEENAKKWIGKSPDHRISEFPVDEFSDEPVVGLLLYMDMETGDLRKDPKLMAALSYDNQFCAADVNAYLQILTVSIPTYLNGVRPTLQMFCPYTDVEKAIKSCNEKRAQLIALGRTADGYYDRETLVFIGD